MMKIVMPQLGETVTEGTVAKWYKNVGDRVRADELLFEVETEKAITEIPALDHRIGFSVAHRLRAKPAEENRMCVAWFHRLVLGPTSLP